MEESRIKHRGVVSAELSEFCAKAKYQLQITIPWEREALPAVAFRSSAAFRTCRWIS